MTKNKRILYFSLFIPYIIIVMFLVFSPHFPFKLDIQDGNIPTMIRVLKAPVFYIPFQETISISFWLNVIMTVPFGSFLRLIFCKRLQFKLILTVGVIVGLFIETIQFIFDNFIPGFSRYVDINDLISNAFGVVVGYYLMMLMYKILLKLKNNTISR